MYSPARAKQTLTSLARAVSEKGWRVGCNPSLVQVILVLISLYGLWCLVGFLHSWFLPLSGSFGGSVAEQSLPYSISSRVLF